MESLFEKMGGTYIKCGDYYVPNLGQFDDETEIDDRPYGKYGMLRERYLKEHRQALYSHLVLNGELHSHLQDVQEQAQSMLDNLIPQYKAKQGVTEELKATDQLLWVQKMNAIVVQIEEFIFSELIYR